MHKNRMFILAFVLILVVAAALGGWVLGSNIVTPAEAAARTAPPTPSPILVPVESRVLSTDIVTRGTARFGLPQAVSVVPSSLKTDYKIVTSLPELGTQLEEGDVLLTISGRPVFLLQGESPAFRDFVPGLKGDDVYQLEQALERMGFNPGTVDGIYDEATGEAIEVWYSTTNWQAIGSSEEQLTRIQELEYDLAIATSEQATANDATATGLLQIEAARANAASANQAALANLPTLTSSHDAIFADSDSTQAQRDTAKANLEAAETAVTAVQLEAELAIQTATNAYNTALREAEIASIRVEQIQSELTRIRSEIGTRLPVDELIFLPLVPVRIDHAEVQIGDEPHGELITVTNNQLAIDSSLPLDEAPLVKEGMLVTIDEPSLGIKATGVVSMVAGTPGTFGVDGFHVYFEVRVDETEQTLEGFSLRLTIPIESTGGEVTAVPISALSLAADGTSRVQIANNGEFEFITVIPGLAADGFVEVTPINGNLEPGQLIVIGFE